LWTNCHWCPPHEKTVALCKTFSSARCGVIPFSLECDYLLENVSAVCQWCAVETYFLLCSISWLLFLFAVWIIRRLYVAAAGQQCPPPLLLCRHGLILLHQERIDGEQNIYCWQASAFSAFFSFELGCIVECIAFSCTVILSTRGHCLFWSSSSSCRKELCQL
jgi:hypothetical protein